MKRIAVIVLVLSLSVGGWYILNAQKKMDTSGLQNEVMIEMLDDSYSPSDVTIKKGSTVVFINKSSEWRWPASNLHPTHDIYPEFDPKEPVAPGDTWSFMFDKTGPWRMHDHLAPYITGTIIVE